MNIYNVNGDLSLYGLSCGYVQKYQWFGMNVELHCEHGQYVVTFKEWDKPAKRLNFENGNKARKLYKTIVKLMKKQFYNRLNKLFVSN